MRTLSKQRISRRCGALDVVRTVAAVGALTLTGACGPSGSTGDAGVDASTGGDGATMGQPAMVRFRATVGERAFACGQSYDRVGMGATGTWRPKDFRLYVSNVVLTTAAGGEVPFVLDEDGTFQGRGVALLDFEDATMGCTGTAGTHMALTGRVAAGAYTGIRFTIGVPFELNHADPTTAPAPLNDSSLWWTWNSGYRFARLDGTTTGVPMGFNVHLGSTGCSGNGAGAVNPCRAPNRVEISLAGFDPTSATSTITLDLGALLAQTNVDQNTTGSAPGCMSDPDDADCAGIFANLGLAFGSMPANPGAQRFVRGPNP